MGIFKFQKSFLPLYYVCDFFDSNFAALRSSSAKIYCTCNKFCLVINKLILAVPAVEFTDLLADFLRLMLRS